MNDFRYLKKTPANEKNSFKSGDKKIIRDAIFLLSPRERRIIRLRFWEDLSLTEVSLRTGLSWETTVQIFDQALTKLRTHCLSDQNFSLSPEYQNHKSNCPKVIFDELIAAI